MTDAKSDAKTGSQSDAEFDRHAATYRDLHKTHMALSGEEPAYFADYKMRDFSVLLGAAALPLDGRYLDYGCGVGASIAPFHQHLPKAQLVCADVSADSIELAKQAHGGGQDYAWMPDGKLPLADQSVDGAFACCVFHHIPHDQHAQTLQELRRVLKPGGLLMIYEHNPYNPLTVRTVRNCPFDENAVLMKARALQKTCDAAGLQRYRSDYRVFFPAALTWLRPLEDGLRWLPLGAQYFVATRK